ncbi:DnaD domain protein [Paenibacillus sp. TRM 82003]|nr:DnaD domain protein [Paenibacillus sp. TRM 82003]
MNGYIKDHRKEVESDIWKMPPLYHRLWQWLKYNVNHEETDLPMRDGTKLHINRGQRLTSVRDIAKAIGWYEGVKWKEPNPKTVSVILEWMVKQGMISIERGHGNRQYTLITIVNWEIYNPKEGQGNSKVTAREHLVDINKNDNNDFILSTTSTTETPTTIGEANTRIYGTLMMSGMLQGFVVKYKTKGFTDTFIIEVLMEAAETCNGGKPPIKFIETIAERWEREGIYSRYQNEQQKQKAGETNEQPRGRTQTVTPFRNTRKGEALFSDDELDEYNRDSAAMFNLR